MAQSCVRQETPSCVRHGSFGNAVIEPCTRETRDKRLIRCMKRALCRVMYECLVMKHILWLWNEVCCLETRDPFTRETRDPFTRETRDSFITWEIHTWNKAPDKRLVRYMKWASCRVMRGCLCHETKCLLRQETHSVHATKLVTNSASCHGTNESIVTKWSLCCLETRDSFITRNEARA